MLTWHTPGEQIRLAQMILVICCLCYGKWWYVAFRPEADNRTLAGYKGGWFALTIITGSIGVFLNAAGVHALPEAVDCSVHDICRYGVIAYVVLLVLTFGLLRRPITAELALIVAWCGMEISAVQALASGKYLPDNTAAILVSATFGATSLFLLAYTVYYKLEAVNAKAAFWLGMVPLALAAMIMGAVAFSVV